MTTNTGWTFNSKGARLLQSVTSRYTETIEEIPVKESKTMWVIQCQVEHVKEDGWSGSYQVPTFNLNPDYVGTNLEVIEKIAREIVDPLNKAVAVHVSAVLV